MQAVCISSHDHFFLLGFVCFSNPTSPPRSPIGSVPCVPTYTLSPPAFQGVTPGMSSHQHRTSSSQLGEASYSTVRSSTQISTRLKATTQGHVKCRSLYHSSGPNTGSNTKGGRIQKKTYCICSFSTVLINQ